MCKFFPLRAEPNLEGTRHSDRQAGNHKSCLPLKNNIKHGGAPTHLNHFSCSLKFKSTKRVWLAFVGYLACFSTNDAAVQ